MVDDFCTQVVGRGLQSHEDSSGFVLLLKVLLMSTLMRPLMLMALLDEEQEDAA